MNREIKFRAFSTDRGSYYKTFLGDIQYFVVGDGTHLYTTDIIQLSTGLKDKNGKEIFEGDILDFPFNLGIAYIVNDGFRFAVKSPGSEAIDYESSDTLQQCEIIGNIYENPELLKP